MIRMPRPSFRPPLPRRPVTLEAEGLSGLLPEGWDEGGGSHFESSLDLRQGLELVELDGWPPEFAAQAMPAGLTH